MANKSRYTGVLHHLERAPKSDDGRNGSWSRARLERMNERFARAIAREERQQSAPAQAKKDNNR